MIEPRRLLEDPELADEARELLRALPVPAEPSSAKTAALASRLGQMLHAPGALSAPAVKTALWLKVSFVVGALGLVGVGLHLLSGPKPPKVASHAPEVASILPPPPSAVAVGSAGASEQAEPAPQPSASLSATAPSARAPRDTLAAEEALLEQARKTAASSPGRALALLQQYKQQFPHGQLSAERMFLSADVLSRLGNQAAAQRERDALVRSFPRSVYAAQVKGSSSR